MSDKPTMLNEADTSEDAVIHNSATYCAEDNKLRLYLSARVEHDSYNYLRKIGYKATPKQDCDFVATWSPRAEDAAFALIPADDDIGDEDYSPEERAADRAERFSGYRDKRRSEAHGHADTFDAGPAAHGYQSQARAERAASRHGRYRDRALSQWSKAEYWQMRTAGVISHALHKSSARVRRGRILEIEKRIRYIEASYTPKDLQQIVMQHSRAANYDYETRTYDHEPEPHVWCGKGRGGHWVAVASLERIKSAYSRELAHLNMRLIYENAMLENEGGKVSDVEMIPGGFIAGRQIHKVNKSPETRRVVSVTVMGEDFHGTPALVSVNIERLGEEVYRAPTPEELKAFKAEKKSAPKKPSLINPTLEDAKRLQAVRGGEVEEMTQRQYSARLKRSDWYGSASLANDGRLLFYRGDVNKNADTIVCKVRNESRMHGPSTIIVLTDKPQKPLPLDWDVIEAPAEQPETCAV